MSRYRIGDVLLVPFPFGKENTGKMRPAIVVSIAPEGDPVCCPIRSNPPERCVCIPIGIGDFASGGLDLFSESFIQIDTVRRIRGGTVAAKKGTVREDFLAILNAQIRK